MIQRPHRAEKKTPRETPMTDILHGDCRTRLREIAPGTVDCVITSPPFWRGPQGSWAAGEIGGEAHHDTYIQSMVTLFAAVRWTLAPTGHVWLVLGEGARTLGTPEGKPWAVINDLARDGWHIAAATAWDDTVVVQLSLFQRGGHGCPVPPYNNTITDRPYAPLSREFIGYCLNTSTLENDTVLDPCCGTGTVGITATDLKREFIGIELNPEQAQLAQARVKHYKKLQKAQ
jgi:DNA modification methylase